MRVEEHLKHGLMAHQSGALPEAESHYRAALASDPRNFPAARLLGMLCIQRQNFAEADRLLRLALSLNPNDASAQQNHATALLALTRFEDALAGCDRAIALMPGNFAAHYTRARALAALERTDEALAGYRLALSLKPDFSEALQESGSLLLHLGRAQEALAACERVLALQPGHVPGLRNCALALQMLGRLSEAVQCWERAIAGDPGDAGTHVDLGYTLQRLGQHAQALAAFDKAAALNPDAPYLSGARLFAKMSLGDWSNFDRDCVDVLARVERAEKVGPPFYLLPIPSSPAQQLAAARTFTADQYLAAKTPMHRNFAGNHPRIRIGYLSTDFRNHAVAMLLAGIIEQHDKTEFETFALSLSAGDGSIWRQRLEAAFEHFVHLEQLSDPEAASRIRDLEIDILIDLNGHTSGARTGILARRAAPLQVNFLGFPATMGADYVDYIIADRALVRPEDESHFSEKLAAMPVCYQPNARRPIAERTPSRAECGLPETGFVLCCFNHSYKITPDIFGIWMRLLRAVPGSVLWLKHTGSDARANLVRAARAEGVAADRLVFAPQVEHVEDHLARHRLADLFVDTLYYNAHSTASDALMCGLPLLTCAGNSYASRVSASLLQALDLTELVTRSPEKYEAAALRLMGDGAALAALKAKLAANLSTSPLFDSARFTRDLERAYRTMWDRRKKGLAPARFDLGKE